MAVSLTPVSSLTPGDREAVAALSRAVYPPAEWADWAGRSLEWAEAEWCVRIFADDVLLHYTGIVLRDGVADGRPTRIGGVGGVKTHPDGRGRGYARSALEAALRFFQEQPDVAFALLVCEPHLLPYYAALGWQEFRGRVLVRQRGAVAEFTFNRVMTHSVRRPAPVEGTIDLCGPPW